MVTEFDCIKILVSTGSLRVQWRADATYDPFLRRPRYTAKYSMTAALVAGVWGYCGRESRLGMNSVKGLVKIILPVKSE